MKCDGVDIVNLCFQANLLALIENKQLKVKDGKIFPILSNSFCWRKMPTWANRFENNNVILT
jgi:hypothetical protein